MNGPGQRRPRHCFIDTLGSAFNLLVGAVLIVNAIFLAVEADLGLLGVEDARNYQAHYDGLQTDLGYLHMAPATKSYLAEEAKGLSELDANAKQQLQQSIKAGVKKDVDLERGEVGGSTQLAYTVCEYFFVVFYVFEFVIRLCDMRIMNGHCSDDPWILLDGFVVALGVADVTLPLVVASSWTHYWLVLALLRMSRILRVFRLFRIFAELRSLARPLIYALLVVLRVGVLIVIFNFAISLVLTALIGRKAEQYSHPDEVAQWFGSVGRSMTTLFAIMTLSGWNDIALVLQEVVPGAVVGPAMVLYLALCTVAAGGLVVGVIGDAFAAATRDADHQRSRLIEQHRKEVTQSMASLLATCEQSRNGSLTREELATALEMHPATVSQLKALDNEVGSDDILYIFDQLSEQDVVKVDVLVEALAHHIAGHAKAYAVFDVKHQLRCLRAENVAQSGAAKQAMLDKHTEATTLVTSLGQEVGQIQESVASIIRDGVAQQRRVQELRGEMTGIMGRIDGIEKQPLAVILSTVSGLATKMAADAAQSEATQKFILERVGSVGADLSASSKNVETLASEVSKQGALQRRAAEDLADVSSKLAALEVSMRLLGKATPEPEHTPCHESEASPAEAAKSSSGEPETTPSPLPQPEATTSAATARPPPEPSEPESELSAGLSNLGVRQTQEPDEPAGATSGSQCEAAAVVSSDATAAGSDSLLHLEVDQIFDKLLQERQTEGGLTTGAANPASESPPEGTTTEKPDPP
eukprot:TRINITY_DN27044_c0_g8_i1.p1 TRINITY_DN27044_c0_g8~~TRINITY_DN27044_c0_g8_i1.p1  ORF type:complete len:825 (+),score=110.92 TRINITY_DN27044_c0_g8_i1:212-2476(+)